jgi:hypothetical protein
MRRLVVSRRLHAAARAFGFGATLAAVAFSLWACNSHPLSAPKPQPVAENVQLRELNPIRNVDILFVIDNSGSMREEQMNLAQNFPAFMDELRKIDGADLQIAVTSTDLGGGAMTARTTCPTVGGDRGVFCGVRGKDCRACGLGQGSFLTYRGNGTQTNFTGDIGAAFSCMASLGTAGCSFEHSLEAIRRSLAAPENRGFVRAGSYLAIIIITDEDDCSAASNSTVFATDDVSQEWSLRCALNGHVCSGKALPRSEAVSVPLSDCRAADSGGLVPIADIVKAVVDVKKDPRYVIVSGIFGWPMPGTEPAARYNIARAQGSGRFTLQPICSSANGSATPALRVKNFVDSFNQSSVFSICQNNFREAMQKIGEKIKVVIGPPCIDAPLFDAKPQTPDVLDPECVVADRKPIPNAYQDRPLPKCAAGGPRPCWNLVRDPVCTASGYRVDVDRAGAIPEAGLIQSVKCLTCARPGCK